MPKTLLNPTPPIPGVFMAICTWFRRQFGLNLFGGRFHFETGLWIGGVQITPDDARKIKALTSDLALETPKNPRNKHPAKSRDAPLLIDESDTD